ncbi:hypothetical protein G5714_023105 [Onychostoma macrolepis]|uniref:Uncharacterized protein n=1 Tax=Onychostoma macrolepis TaxID=369639 RepID=A0A7J6BPD5_9TELE|nr:hypothetical protein G5714_023105 [Onychostoma macrolepis]
MSETITEKQSFCHVFSSVSQEAEAGEEPEAGDVCFEFEPHTYSEFSWSPEFIQELLPSAERTALLYHLSYLCLGSFPKLERLIRERALDTQLLFGSSETVLLKCVSTSSNLVSSLFPMLMKAVEKNKPVLAVRYLEKARTWINDIIRSVDDMVKRYDQQNRSVATCTSDVIQEQKETEEKITTNTKEMESLKEAVDKLEEELRNHNRNMEELEKKIEDKNHELQNHITNSSKKRFCILRALVPFYAVIQDAKTTPAIAAKTQSLNADLSRLNSEKSCLQNKDWNIQVRLTDLQLKLATSKIQLGVIPSPVHLKDVQQCLSRIQQILVQLQKFWEKVGTLLDALKEKTFVNEDLIEDLDDMKDDFLTSIEAAGKYWQRFGECCQRAQVIFSIQSKDAYKFLETNPSSLSKDEWEKQRKSIMERLNEISPQGSSTANITE